MAVVVVPALFCMERKKKTEIREQCGEIIDWGDTQQRPSVLQRELEVQGKDTQLSLYFIQSGIVLCLTTN